MRSSDNYSYDTAVADHPDQIGKIVTELRRQHKQIVIAIKRERTSYAKHKAMPW